MSTPQVKPTLVGSLRMFKIAGIAVYVHWSWLLVAYVEIQLRANHYSSQFWNVAEYTAIFVIVLVHEFGHAIACRQVGGKAEEIVLWPLGGLAFVQPPPRPGAALWSIAAGPLVNVLLVPLTLGAWFIAAYHGLQQTNPDLYRFLTYIWVINLFLLIFNMLPIYPLDGGQILQAILWFIIGRARSLLVVSVVGMAAVPFVIALAIWRQDIWIGVLAAFAAQRSWAGFQQARLLAKLAETPRHPTARCPSCAAHALVGAWWTCQCGAQVDIFASAFLCPRCSIGYANIACPECLAAHPIAAWFSGHIPPGAGQVFDI